MIYQPHVIEIRATMAQVRSNWPQLGAYADRAEQILLNGDIFYRDGWRVYAASDGIESYQLTESGCSCPAAATHNQRTPCINGRAFCKHRIAYLAYLRILRDHLRDRWIGSDGNAPNIHLLRHFPDVYVAIDLRSGETRANEQRTLGVRVRTARDGETDFADARSAHAFARWLGEEAQEIPQSRPDRPQFLPDPSPGKQWQPQWSTDQFQEWLETGEVPGAVPAWMKDQI
jgi:hypothetical protein